MANSSMEEALGPLKKAVFSLQMTLLDGISSDTQLQAAGRVLTQNEYADVVTERSIVKLCGLPVCRNALPDNPPRKGRYRISLRERKVYDLQDTRLFCSSDCLIASRTFAASLQSDRDAFLDSSGVVELATAFQNLSVHGSGQVLQENRSNDNGKASENENGKDAASFLLIHEQSEVQVESFDRAGPSDAVEGYVPQRGHAQVHAKQSFDEVKEADAGNRQDKVQKRETSKRRISSGKAQRARHGGKEKVEAVSLASLTEAASTSSSFTSCILLDVEPVKNSAQGVIDLGSSEPTLQPALKHKKKQHARCRVSWADHNNQNLVEVAGSESQSDPNCASEVIQEARNPECLDSIDHGTAQAVASACPSSEDSSTTDNRVAQSSRLWTHQVEAVAVAKTHSEAFEKQPDDLKNDRLESAEALAAALAEAAEAVASGEVDVDEAVATAGISIMSASQEEVQGLMPFERRIALADESGPAPLQNGPEASHLPEEDELEEVDPRECWYSAPPKDFIAELSTFGTLWMALDGWISAASIAHIYGRDASEEDSFTSINGKEYLRHVTIGDGVTVEIERTLAGCISRALPGVVEALRLSIPISTLEQHLGHLLRTMSLVESLPPFGTKQWRMIVTLLLDALSVQRLPLLRNQLLNSRIQLRKVLDSVKITEAEYEAFKDLILPMGRHPEFAAHCGG